MHKLLPYFEREMSALRKTMQDAAKRHPTLASALGLSGGLSTDPGAQRIMEGTALLGAQIARKLDFYHTRLTNDLLGILGPFYLNPIPSCPIACFEPIEKREITTIPRGTEMRALTRADMPLSHCVRCGHSHDRSRCKLHFPCTVDHRRDSG